MDDDVWMIYGDFNMVDLLDGTRGKSTYIKGGEERIWSKIYVDKFGSVDSYLITS